MDKGTGTTFEYQLTRFGHLFALLIEIRIYNNGKHFESFYSLFKKHFEEEPSSIDSLSLAS
ncbi:MAG TPA: hypothetical protein VIY08_11375 [Candidatus Nitrosocosmicus sp.]